MITKDSKIHEGIAFKKSDKKERIPENSAAFCFNNCNFSQITSLFLEASMYCNK